MPDIRMPIIDCWNEGEILLFELVPIWYLRTIYDVPRLSDLEQNQEFFHQCYEVPPT